MPNRPKGIARNEEGKNCERKYMAVAYIFSAACSSGNRFRSDSELIEIYGEGYWRGAGLWDASYTSGQAEQDKFVTVYEVYKITDGFENIYTQWLCCFSTTKM